MSLAPGTIRDSIVDFLGSAIREASIKDIAMAVERRTGTVAASSVRSYLNLNTPGLFERSGRGRYRLDQAGEPDAIDNSGPQPVSIGKASLYHADCFDWLARQPSHTIHAVVADPPYGLVEYTAKETTKLRAGKGGVWRLPPSFDGNRRAPLPRFTVLDEHDRIELHKFFKRLGILLAKILVPGGNVVIASNSLLVHIVSGALCSTGLELRGTIARLVMTMRGGDRPKNAHLEYDGVSVMPRSQWEPWLVLRKPLDGRVQDNLRRWKTGGFRRISQDRPFGDLIRSNPTSAAERKLAPHPSLKPQAFMRQLVRAVLPLGEGLVLDPFMGAGSTLAAANFVGYDSIGIEQDAEFFELAKNSIPSLASLRVEEKFE